jgi:DNA mismatch repair protein MutL
LSSPDKGTVRGGPRSGGIALLDESVILGIAAGEVVERPASVVKELVENALDAGATVVHVEYDDREDSQRLLVRDNGCGIEPSQVELALTRHATSKISSLLDLEKVSTFGFRGEALASIAAVGRVSLTTRTAGRDSAVRVMVDGGRVSDRSEAGAGPGSSIEVRDLFWSVPARRKFLKSRDTEFQQVLDTVRRFALLSPSVGFRMLRNGADKLDCPAVNTSLERVRQVLGAQVSEKLVGVEGGWEGMGLEGFVSAAGESWGTSRHVHLFVNGRWVKDKLLFKAVTEAYRGYLLKGRFPAVVIELTVDPSAVDVNVHPAKMELRFCDPGQVHRFVVESIRVALRGADALRGVELSRGNRVERAWTVPASAPLPTTVGEPPPGYVETSEDAPAPVREIVEQVALEMPGVQQQGTLSHLEVLGQAFDGYIVCQSADTLVLVDQHAAHERLLYENLIADCKSGNIEVQSLLLPITVSVGSGGVAAVTRRSSDLLAAGWEIEAFGEEEVIVRSLPALASHCDMLPLVEGLVADLVETGSTGKLDALIERVLATVACHSAVRVGTRMDLKAARALLERCSSVEFVSACPHGRPVAREIPRSRLERMFGRSATGPASGHGC